MQKIFMNKKKLKGKRSLITQSLTSSRIQLLVDAKKIRPNKCLDI